MNPQSKAYKTPTQNRCNAPESFEGNRSTTRLLDLSRLAALCKSKVEGRFAITPTRLSYLAAPEHPIVDYRKGVEPFLNSFAD